METKIYLVTNIENNPFKIYIGKTKNCRKNNHETTYGKQITYDYIDEVDSLDYKDYGPIESFWIRYFRFLGFEVLNDNEGGGGPSKWSDELLNSEENKQRIEKIKNNKERGRKISEKLKGRVYSEETIKRMSKPKSEEHKKNLRKPRSEEFKKKIAKALKGRPSPMKGKKLTDEQKQKMSDRMKGKSYMKGKKRPDLKDNPSNTKPVIQFDLEGNPIKEWSSATEAARSLGINNTVCISKCCQGKSKTANGYKWKFKNK